MNQQSAGNATPLYTAARHGKLEIIPKLVESKANVNHTLSDGRSALHAVAQLENRAAEAIKLLLQTKAEVNQVYKVDSKHKSALSIAAQEGVVDALKPLMAARADMNLVTDKNAKLWVATCNGHVEDICTALEAKADVNQVAKDGRSPLSLAAALGPSAALPPLLEAKANVNWKCPDGHSAYSSMSVLHFACSHSRINKFLPLLLEAKADVNQEDGTRKTPLIRAVDTSLSMSEETRASITLLLDAKSSVNHAKDDGRTPLINTAENTKCKNSKEENEGILRLLDLLIAARASVNQAQNSGKTALHAASSYDHFSDILEVLLQARADVNLAQNQGRTPLFAACKNGAMKAICKLLDAKANANHAENNGDTALSAAVLGKQKKAIEKLLEAGAVLDVITNPHTQRREITEATMFKELKETNATQTWSGTSYLVAQSLIDATNRSLGIIEKVEESLLKSKEEQWSDSEFPAVQQSLYLDDTCMPAKDQAGYLEVEKWERLSAATTMVGNMRPLKMSSGLFGMLAIKTCPAVAVDLTL